MAALSCRQSSGDFLIRNWKKIATTLKKQPDPPTAFAVAGSAGLHTYPTPTTSGASSRHPARPTRLVHSPPRRQDRYLIWGLTIEENGACLGSGRVLWGTNERGSLGLWTERTQRPDASF
ncbi:hypothetical protein N656DRAFT_598819 [Canariomyces notabilis]|uniref:Uncharacterized protein n=1 Tax=Canariomyces notabilis TaxID=2074819 RepID=A0AAN6TGL0_9PEZI|nr:hypothetical protein N656DRAFT_598819 [Canariomyces arenarius]